MNSDSLIRIMMRILIMFLAIPVHEAAHAYAAKLCGDDTAEKQGRLTLNPFAHLDVFGSLLMIISGFGWGKPVMVNSSNFKHKKLDAVIVALAGPLSNIVFSFVLVLVYRILWHFEVINETGTLPVIITYIILLNVYLAVFNAIPVPPLDGSKLLLAVLPSKAAFWLITHHNIVFGIMLVLLWFTPFSGVLSMISDVIVSAMFSVTSFIG